MGTRRKLLLADDSITIQKVVNLTFADEGFDVTAVGRGDLAVEMLEEIEPDIVLADVHMPGLNGYEVCESVKRNERFRGIPVMLLVGSFEPFDEAEARRVGADDYLTKPFQSIRQLVSRVGSLLSGRSSVDESTREIDPDAFTEANQSEASSSPSVPVDATVGVEAATAKETSEDTFGDPIFDDAMIEATPAGDFNMNRAVNSTQRGTTPLSESDLIDAGLNDARQSSIHTDETLRMDAKEVWSDHGATLGEVIAPVPRDAKQISPDNALLDLGDDEPQLAARNEDEFVLDIWDDPPAKESSIPVELAEQGVVRYEGEVNTIATPAAQLAEVEVVEVEPQVDSGAVREFESEASPVSSAVDDSSVREQRTGQITMEQLSPEAIDAIARRAVEHLSEKVVEQIAWEVVPELAERLIKRRLEEERTQ